MAGPSHTISSTSSKGIDQNKAVRLHGGIAQANLAVSTVENLAEIHSDEAFIAFIYGLTLSKTIYPKQTLRTPRD